MKISSLALSVCVCLSCSLLPPAQAQTMQGMQTDSSDGPIYAAAFEYDSDWNELLITGVIFPTPDQTTTNKEASCMVATFKYPSLQRDSIDVYGSDSVHEACRNIAVIDDDNLIVVGNSEPNGLYYTGNNPQAGFGMVVNRDTGERVVGANLFTETKVPYPQQVVIGPDGAIYIASMTSQDSTTNVYQDPYPNWTYEQKHGVSFEMTVEKFVVAFDASSTGGGSFGGIDPSAGPVLQRVWSQYFPVQEEFGGAAKPTVYVGGLIYQDDDDLLIVVGSTRGKGAAYGPADGDDEDGFLTILDPATGELAAGKDNERYGSDQNDIVTSVCQDPRDPSSIFIVGGTKGDMKGIPTDQTDIPAGSMMAFVKQINLDTLHSDGGRWIRQIGAWKGDDITTAYALGCVVHGEYVYIAGNVEASAGMLEGDKVHGPHGGRDVWVAQLDKQVGTLNWIHQVGTKGDDEMARLGGLQVDADGTAILLGDTNGSLYRNKQEGSSLYNMFIMMFAKANGQYATTLDGDNGLPPAAPVASPTMAPVQQQVQQPVSPATQPNAAVADDISAIQTGPDVGPSYAGGMAYNPDTNSVFVTGATYGAFAGPGIRARDSSDCFFGIIDLPRLEWQQRQIYGTSSVPEACSAIDVNNWAGSKGAVIAGSTEKGGLLADLQQSRSKGLQYGFALDLGLDQKYEFLGGSGVGDKNVNFPVSLTTDGANSAVYIASMTSNDVDISPDYEKVNGKTDYPNFTSGGIEKWGVKYDINIEKFSMNRDPDVSRLTDGTLDRTITTQWSKPFMTADHKSVYISGMTIIEGGQTLLAVGTTTPKDSDNLDGLMAKIKTDNGNFQDTRDGGKTVSYFTSVSGNDDWIMNVCADPADPETFYVVGASQGVISSEHLFDNEGDPIPSEDFKNDDTTRPFVAKMHAKTLEAVWVKSLTVTPAAGGDPANTAAVALGCDVLPDGKTLYIAGNVENGATIINTSRPLEPFTSAGKDDIFVAHVRTKDGHVQWIQQTGSNGNDRVARAGGVKVDDNQNAVVFGDTSGDFFRSRSLDNDSRQSDLFLMIFNKADGMHATPLVGLPQSDNDAGDGNADTPDEWYSDAAISKKKSGGKIFGIVILVVVLVALFGLLLIWFCRRWRSRRSLVSHKDNFGMGDDDDLGMSVSDTHDSGLVSTDTAGYRDDPLVGLHHRTYNDLPAGKTKSIV